MNKEYILFWIGGFLIGLALGLAIGIDIGTEYQQKEINNPYRNNASVLEPFEDEVPVVQSEFYFLEDETLEEELNTDGLEWLALAVEAEAGNQSDEGKRLVCDVILNRVDHEDFPNSIEEVIFQKNQFSIVNDKRIYSVNPSDEIFDLVQAELKNRTNEEVLFFRTEKFHEYGTAWKKVGDHYFSTGK